MENTYCYKNNPIVKSIFLSMLFPTVLMNLTTAIGSFADTVVIGYFLDDLSLSVVTFATPIYMVINTFAALFAVGGSIGMSIDAGKGEKATSNKVFSLAMELLIFVGLLMVMAGLLFGKQITTWLGPELVVFDQVYIYSMIVMMGAPIFMINIGLAFFVRNDGRPTLAMVGMFVSIFVDLITNIIFIGPLHMGVAGAAYSTVLGQLISVLIIGSHFFSKKCTLRFCFNFNSEVLRIIRNGFSTALHFIYQFLTILLMNHFVVSLAGTNGVVVYTIVFNLYTVSLALFEGISQTIQPMVSLYHGENSVAKIGNTLRLSFLAAVIICGGVTVLLEMFPQVVPFIFGVNDSTLLADSALAVRLYSISMVIMTINVILGYYFQSTEYSFMAAVLVSLRCCILFLGSAFVLGKLFGMNGVWCAYLTAEVLTFFICFLMIKAKQKKLIKEGIETNIYLLNKKTAAETICFTCSKNDNLVTYADTVIDAMKKTSSISEVVARDAEAYLRCLIKGSIKRYIEVEINGNDGKVIIRDDMDHTALPDNIQNTVTHGSKAEYGPVLGWNRICLE